MKRCLYAIYTGWLTDGKKFDSSRDGSELIFDVELMAVTDTISRPNWAAVSGGR